MASNYVGIYLKDSWTVGRRLTLNSGCGTRMTMRLCPTSAARPQRLPPTSSSPPSASKVQLPIWNSVAPRLHAAFDLSGDGKTVIKGGWGRYDQMRQFMPT